MTSGDSSKRGARGSALSSFLPSPTNRALTGKRPQWRVRHPALLSTQAEQRHPNAEIVLQLRHQAFSRGVQDVFRRCALVGERATDFAPGSLCVPFFGVLTPGRPLLLGGSCSEARQRRWWCPATVTVPFQGTVPACEAS